MLVPESGRVGAAPMDHLLDLCAESRRGLAASLFRTMWSLANVKSCYTPGTIDIRVLFKVTKIQ